MPPKTNKKPLTALQRKQIKRKRDLIHKATVKSQYYKTINKQDDDTPDYVKDIFGKQEKTVDSSGNVVDLQRSDVEESEPESQSESESEDESRKNKRQQRIDALSKKPNPFQSQMAESERRKRETADEKKERKELYKKQKEERHVYYKDRSDKRRQMMAKTKKGQPRMAARMNVLLERIEKGTK
ncbi:hypothetical protein BY458DRAFT_591240 [Sporodiniella umbellata]|nr:hypothetical protein BY458DRAFT_591240 [Sporodiniella umbellata]